VPSYMEHANSLSNYLLLKNVSAEGLSTKITAQFLYNFQSMYMLCTTRSILHLTHFLKGESTLLWKILLRQTIRWTNQSHLC
jgi:hypothetical protein